MEIHDYTPSQCSITALEGGDAFLVYESDQTLLCLKLAAEIGEKVLILHVSKTGAPAGVTHPFHVYDVTSLNGYAAKLNGELRLEVHGDLRAGTAGEAAVGALVKFGGKIGVVARNAADKRGAYELSSGEFFQPSGEVLLLKSWKLSLVQAHGLLSPIITTLIERG